MLICGLVKRFTGNEEGSAVDNYFDLILKVMYN